MWDPGWALPIPAGDLQPLPSRTQGVLEAAGFWDELFSGLTGNGWEIGHIIAKLLFKAGTAENPGESCFREDVGFALPPVHLWCVWMLLCLP